MLIRGAMMITPSGPVQGDLRVTGDKISEVAAGGGLSRRPGESIIEGEGLHLLPGVMDPQVHFREPGEPHKETLASGSAAGASGGLTAFLDMPNNNPSATSMAAMNAKLQRARSSCVTHHGFFIGATSTNIEQLMSAVGTPHAPLAIPGICGIKIFMGSSTGDLLVDEQDPLERIFSSTGGLIAVHAEDETRLRSRAAEFEHRQDSASHAEWRDSESALLATRRAVDLAEQHHHRLHVLHLTSAVEANWLAGRTGSQVTTETLPQHLTFAASDVEREGTRLKMNPPIRYEEDRDALWTRLHDGTIQCIATDHAPHTLAAKQAGWKDAPAGMPGVETSLPVMLTHASEDRCSISDVVRWMSTNPARIYGVESKGELREGFDADLVLVDMHTSSEVRDERTWTNVGWNPFAGRSLVGWPRLTIVEGIPVFERDSSTGPKGRMIASPVDTGRALEFSI